MQCAACKGRGKIEHGVMPEPVASVTQYNPDATFYIEMRHCTACGGSGQHRGRIPVIQDGRKIGTVPASFDPLSIKSVSRLYTPRAGDFRIGGDGWVANPMLGSGDLEAVPGFVWDHD